MRFTRFAIVLAGGMAAFSATASAQKPIPLDVAENMAHEALTCSRAHGYKTTSVVIVDHFMMQRVMLADDDAPPSTTQTCKIKADSAILFDRPSGDHLPPGATADTPTVTPGATRHKGGAPIKVNGVTIGAIGISGDASDGDCAKATVAKFADKLK